MRGLSPYLYELDGALTMQCAAILEKLMKGKHGPLFSSPVEWNAGYLPDYPQYVKCPMDLGLVHKNLTAGRYARLEDFALLLSAPFCVPDLDAQESAVQKELNRRRHFF